MAESANTPPDIAITRMIAADLAAVQVIEEICGLQPWGTTGWQRDLRNQQAILLLARSLQPQPPQVVGYLHAWVVVDEFQLNNMAVHPDYRRQGIGAALLAEAGRTAIERGAVAGVLEVRAANIAAQALYRQWGFQVISRRKAYYQTPPDDALLMRCDFSNDTWREKAAEQRGHD